MSRRIRTRFAPSPTGPLHMGGVRTALYSYLFAKKHHGDFILRIEDTDTARTVAGSVDIINQSLSWCGIIPDESIQKGGEFAPYIQSERKDIYFDHAMKLIFRGKAYYAFDTDEEIARWRTDTTKINNGTPLPYNFITRKEMKNSLTMSSQEVEEKLAANVPYVVRLLVNEEDTITFHDAIRGDVTFQSHQLDDRILLKSDGMPTYHLANVVDDYLMEISHVIRGEEWLPSTPHHILLYRGFGWEDSMPIFAHLPLILKPDGKGKLSKRDGDRLGFPVFAIDWTNPATGEISKGYRERGFEPEAFINFMAMLGWNDGTEKELFSINELIASFSLDRVHKAGAKFSYEKAIWYNQQYIHHLPLEEFTARSMPYLLAKYPHLTPQSIRNYCELFQDRVHFISEIDTVGDYLLSEITEYDQVNFNKKWSDSSAPFFDKMIAYLSSNSDVFSVENIEQWSKNMMEQNQWSMGQIMPILRIALTGTMKGPAVFDTMQFLGKDRCIARLKEITNLKPA